MLRAVVERDHQRARCEGAIMGFAVMMVLDVALG